ncbi:MAG: hypothetical protein CMK92_03825 [Pseudomonas sp.]|nr:hypothetical protein [Pseudomonas sp.]
MWPIAVMAVCVVTLCVIIIVSLVRYNSTTRYTNAIQDAWSPSGSETDYQRYVNPNPPKLGEGDETDDRLALADMIIRMQHRTRVDITPPPSTELVAVYGPRGEPYMVGIFRQGQYLVVAFRGTMTDAEMRADMRMDQVDFGTFGKVHRGFHDQYVLYAEHVTPWIQKHDGPTWIIGHSLGGALATMFYQVNKGEFISGLTFGSPRVGDDRFADMLDDNIVRIVNRTDIITGLPLTAMPNFTHSSEDLWLYIHGGQSVEFMNNRGSWKANHLMATYIDYLRGTSPDEKNEHNTTTR